MRQPFVPGPGDAELFGGEGRVDPVDRMLRDVGQPPAPQPIGPCHRSPVRALSQTRLRAGPQGGEDADAVRRAEDLDQMLGSVVVRHVDHHGLRDLERRDDVEHQLGDDAQPAEREHIAVEVLARRLAGDSDQRARRPGPAISARTLRPRTGLPRPSRGCRWRRRRRSRCAAASRCWAAPGRPPATPRTARRSGCRAADPDGARGRVDVQHRREVAAPRPGRRRCRRSG